MDKVEKALEVHRNGFKRLYDAVLVLLEEPVVDMIEVQAKMNVLEQKMDIITDLDRQMLEQLLSSEKDTDSVDTETALADEYYTRYHKLKLRIETLRCQEDHKSVRSEALSQSRCKMNLPKIELKKFGGEIKDWLPFWSQFKRIDSDEEIDNEDKFQYLIQATIPNSKARLIVESYPPTGVNYPKAVESLKIRFGRNDILVEYYVRELLKLVLNNLSNRSKLSTLYDRIECQLRALETLDVNMETCAAMLYPLVESCLSEELIRVWQRSSYYDENSSLKNRLEKLMSFLKKEVNNEERISMAIAGFNINKKEKVPYPEKILPSASTLVDIKGDKRCIFCGQLHLNENCQEAKKWPIADRKKKLVDKGCCYICLKFGHIARKCRVPVKCSRCNGRHSTLMCQKSHPVESEDTRVENSLTNNTYTEVFLQTLKVKLVGNNNKVRYARLLFDTGSQKSYITKAAVVDMQYTPERAETMIHALFGGATTDTVTHSCYRIRLRSVCETYACNFEALDHPVICNNIACVKPGTWINELNQLNIQVTDIEDGPIDILVGADIWGKLFTGKRQELSCGLVAFETLLGWTLSGKAILQNSNVFKTPSVSTMFCNVINIADMWNLDILGISDPIESKSRKEIEEAVKMNFMQTVKVQEDGRYEVSMPWIDNHPPLPENSMLAQKRLENLTKKLRNDGYFEDYDSVFRNWLDENIIEEVPTDELMKFGHYLPHRHVVNVNSQSTKIRPVFDASARVKNQPSLNQCLEKGVNFIELIPSILLRFRFYKIGVISDIKKAFLQISLCQSDRDFLRFFWMNKENEMVVYRHTRVVFGITCSPFLLGAVIDYHLRREIEKSDSKYSKSTVAKLMSSFYVDNCVTSVKNGEELQQFIEESTQVMADAKFELRGWEHTCFENSQVNPTNLISVLGLRWNKDLDTLQICSDWYETIKTESITRRTILSAAHKLFDPIGFSSPVSLLPKLLLQKSWKMKAGWDKEVEIDLKVQFMKWFEALPQLFSVKIPRWLRIPLDSKCSLHVFCDASKDAYATVVYIRSELNGIEVQLVQSKCRVAPLKILSIPRLELLAATIGARLSNSVLENFDFDLPVFYWTDSTTVLSWIKRENRWKTFVWNRIAEIKRITQIEAWYYVPTELNPADVPSRGCSAEQLIKSKWWEGPLWLKEAPNMWPSQNFVCNEEMINAEKPKEITSSFISSEKDTNWYHSFSTDYGKIIRVLCWVRRFISKCRKTHVSEEKKIKISKLLSAAEVVMSDKMIVKLIQNESFAGVSDKKLSNFRPFKEKEIIRIQTKVSDRDDTMPFRCPAILPAKHPVVRKIIEYEHRRFCHAGVQNLLSLLRERYWIINGRKEVRSVVSRCVICRRFDAKNMDVSPIPLPKNRVREAAVFEVTGIDMTGPLFARSGVKCWVCLFTCAVFRAVHLELVSSLSTDAFLQAFRRFISRRGRPSIIYSDNGTNFAGAENAFAKLNWEIIASYSSAQRIDWKFIPPTAAWWGGWWEVMIKLVKNLLRKILGKSSLTCEELSTILCECESVINSRPLIRPGEDSNDLVALTPAMFLQEIKESGVPDIDSVDSQTLTKHYRYRLKLKEDLRKRFRIEYLGQLTLQNRKKKGEIKVGDIVLIGHDTKKRINWPLARVEETIPGRDGEIRLVRLKTSDGYLLRPLQRIFPLELSCNAEEFREIATQIIEPSPQIPNIGTSSDTFTRYGRRVKLPQRFES